MIAMICEFEGLSGLVLNNNKSSIMRLGNVDDNCNEIENIKLSSTYNTLGVWFKYKAEIQGKYKANFHYESNFKPVLTKMQTCCDSWSNHCHSREGSRC